MFRDIKEFLKRIPFAKMLVHTFYRLLGSRSIPGVEQYWEKRYQDGGTSGSGSYNKLSEFKANFLNDFVKKNGIQTVIEFGCGDGNQLKLANYPNYVGLDVSPTAINLCTNLFSGDVSKSFYLYHSLAFTDHAGLFSCELALSLDVIFHLVDDEVFNVYMKHLFDAGQKYVIVYSSNLEEAPIRHFRNREFTSWVETHQPNWELIEKVDNLYPFDPANPDETSVADFYVFRRKDA